MNWVFSVSLVLAAVLMVGCSSTGATTSLKSNVQNNGMVFFEGSF
jgi:hypothetical protein